MLVRATKRDFEAVNHLARQVHELHVAWRPDLFVSCKYPLSEDDFQDLLDNDAIYVLRKRGNIIAYITFDVHETEHHSVAFRKIFMLKQICVDESCRNQGLGRQIMEEVKNLAGDLGCTDIQLTCDPHNEAALHLYETFGMNVKYLQFHLKL